MLYYTTLYYAILHCTTLYYTMLRHASLAVGGGPEAAHAQLPAPLAQLRPGPLYYTILYYTILNYTIFYYTIL